MFKILNGYENIDRNIFFTVKVERRTRAHGVTLAKKQCRLDIRKFSFSQRTVNEWNRLSADCVGASSVNIFIKKCFVRLYEHTRLGKYSGASPCTALYVNTNSLSSILCGTGNQ